MIAPDQTVNKPEFTQSSKSLRRITNQQPTAEPYVMIATSLILDPALTNADLGTVIRTLVQITARPDAPISAAVLATPTHGNGRDAIRKAIKTLETRGYLRREKHQTDAGIWHTTINATISAPAHGLHRQPAPTPEFPSSVMHRQPAPTPEFPSSVTHMTRRVTDAGISVTKEDQEEEEEKEILGYPSSVCAAPATATAPQTTMTPAPVTVNRSQPHPAPTVTASSPTPAPESAQDHELATQLIARGIYPSTASELIADYAPALIQGWIDHKDANPKIRAGALLKNIRTGKPAPQLAPAPLTDEEERRRRYCPAELAGIIIGAEEDAAHLVSTETISAASSTAASAPEPAHLVSSAASSTAASAPATVLQNAPARQEDAQTTVYAPAHSEAPQNATTPAQPAQETQPDADPARLARHLDELRRQLSEGGSPLADDLKSATLHDAGAAWLIVGASRIDYLTAKGAIVGKKLATITNDRRPVQYAAA